MRSFLLPRSTSQNSDVAGPTDRKLPQLLPLRGRDPHQQPRIQGLLPASGGTEGRIRQPSPEKPHPSSGEEPFLPLGEDADMLLKWSLSLVPAGWGCTHSLTGGDHPLSHLLPKGDREDPSRTQQSEPLAAPGWGRLVDHGVPGAAPQVGPRCSQLYPLPMAFVFLILCLLLFFNTKRKKKTGLCGMKCGVWEQRAHCGEV